MRFLLFYFLITFVMSTQTKLVMLLSMHRHGARSTEKFFNHTWFPVGKKQLTPLGEAQMQSLGSFYRTNYWSQLYSSENRNEYPIYISSPIKRSVDSAKHVYRGLFPNKNEYNYHEIEIDFTKGWSSQFLNNIKNKGYPIFVQKNDSDYLFHGFQKKLCPKAHRLTKEKMESEESLRKLEELRAELFPTLSKSLKKAMDIHIDPKSMSYSNMKGIYDVVISTQTHKVPVDFGLTASDMEKLSKERRDFVLNHKLGHPTVVKLSTTTFFEIVRTFLLEKKKEILTATHKHDNYLLKSNDEMVSAVDEGNSVRFNRNIVLFSSHDTILNLILNALLDKEEKEKLGAEMDLRYGSHLDIELHQENNSFYIMAYLNGKKVNFNHNCSKRNENKCSLEEFEELIKEWIFEDLEAECHT